MKNYGDDFVSKAYCGDGIDSLNPGNPVNITRINTVRHFELPARYTSNPGEAHPEYEFLYVEKGVFIDKSEQEPVVMHAGDAVIFSPFYFHSTICDGEHSASIFVVSFICDSPLMIETFGEKSRTFIRITAEQHKTLAQAFSAGVKAYRTNSHFCEIKIDPPYINRQVFVNYMEILFLQMISSLHQEKAKEKIFFTHDDARSHITKEVIAFLESKIYSDVTIEQICRHLGYSRGHICNNFKKDTGRTINNYYQSLKIEEAKRLILETSQDIGTIAEILGYSNSQYFNKVFRKFTGYTPGHFRKTIFKGSLETE